MNAIIPPKSRGFIETSLALVLLLILLFELYKVLGVFAGVFTYAIIFSVSFAGLFESMVRLCKNKRGLAAFIYGAILVAVIAVPFYYMVAALVSYAGQVQTWFADAKVNGVPPLPVWVEGVPVAGKKMTAFWGQLQADPSSTLATYEPKIKSVLQGLVFGGAGMVGAVFEFILGIIISAVLLANKDTVLPPIYAMMKKLVGDAGGPPLVDATGRAVKGVAVGVMGTAFIAAFFAWIAFAIAGVPFAVGLVALTFLLVVIQVGPILVFVPAAIWLFSTGQTTM